MKKIDNFKIKVATKICTPYMERLLRTCYNLRSLSYSMPFEKWCEKVNEHLKKEGK